MESEKEKRLKLKNLKWIKRKWGHEPIWVAPSKDYEPRTRSLRKFIGNDAAITAEVVDLNASYKKWASGVTGRVVSHDGTIAYFMHNYLNDPDSTFWSLRPGSRHPYEYYAQKIINEVGDRKARTLTGLDLKRWHDAWSHGGEKLAASKMIRAVLDAAIAHAIVSHTPDSAEFRMASDLRETFKVASRKIPNPKRREYTVDAEQVVALRASAHKDGRVSHALAYAFVFETTLRLWDVIGQWWPVDAPLISDIVMRPHTSMKEPKKWFGLRWEDINSDLVLHYVPSKTSAKTGLAVTFPLRKAPMVMEELSWWPEAGRTGPVIINASNGLPFSSNYFGEMWRRDRKAAGIPSHVWARDLRASGITEGRAAGTATDDVAKVAGHASTKTTSAVYDRAALEAAERFAEARVKRRAK